MDATCAVDENMPRAVLSEALAHVGDLADIRAEDACITSLGLKESKLEEAVRATENGAGTRVFYSSLYVTGTMNT
jgi:DNA-directed RNA polymerase subunit H (RpoH/RPB5)